MDESADRLVAHRGYPGRFPENTMPGLEGALDAGCRWVEVDMQLTSDGVAAAFHDADLERMAAIPTMVANMTWEELSRVWVGESKRFGATFHGVRPVTVEAVADRMTRSAARLFLDVKADAVARFGVERTLAAVQPARDLLGDRLRLIATDVDFLAAARAAGYPIGWILGNYHESTRSAAQSLAPDYLVCNHNRVDGELWSGDWRWMIYVVDEPNAIRSWWDRGAELVETDWIGEVLAATN